MQQLLQPAALGAIAKHDLAQGGAIDLSAGRADPSPVALQHRAGPGTAGRQCFAGVHIRIQQRQAPRRQQPAHAALAAGDAAGEANAACSNHGLRRGLALFHAQVRSSCSP